MSSYPPEYCRLLQLHERDNYPDNGIATNAAEGDQITAHVKRRVTVLFPLTRIKAAARDTIDRVWKHLCCNYRGPDARTTFEVVFADSWRKIERSSGRPQFAFLRLLLHTVLLRSSLEVSKMLLLLLG